MNTAPVTTNIVPATMNIAPAMMNIVPAMMTIAPAMVSTVLVTMNIAATAVPATAEKAVTKSKKI